VMRRAVPSMSNGTRWPAPPLPKESGDTRAPGETVAGAVAPARVVGSRRAAPMGRLETLPGDPVGTSGSAPVRSKMLGSEPFAPAKVRRALSLAPDGALGDNEPVAPVGDVQALLLALR
jgi:hypothetical protein